MSYYPTFTKGDYDTALKSIMMNQAPKATECIVGIRNQLLYQNQLMYINMALEYGGRLGIKLEEIEAIQKIYRWVGKRIGLESDDEQAE